MVKKRFVVTEATVQNFNLTEEGIIPGEPRIIKFVGKKSWKWIERQLGKNTVLMKVNYLLQEWEMSEDEFIMYAMLKGEEAI